MLKKFAKTVLQDQTLTYFKNCSHALSTGSGSLNASNTSSSHLPTKFSQLPNLHTFISSSPLNVLAVLALHQSLLLPGHLHHPLKIIDCSFRYASPRLWNQLPATLRQPYSGTSSSISDSPITSSSFDSPLCTSITFFLFHSRLKTYPFQTGRF